MELSSLDIKFIVQELQYLVGARINKIYHPRRNELYMVIHVPSKGRIILTILLPSLIFIGETKDSNDRPSGFCMGLRKRIQGGRIRAIRQLGFDRIIEFDMEKESKHTLRVELFKKGNISLGKTAINTLEEIEPKQLPETITPTEPLRKYVASTLSMGRYADEFLLRANNDPKRFEETLKSMLKEPLNPHTHDGIITPFRLFSVEEQEPVESFLKALAQIAEPDIIKRKKTEITGSQDKKLEKQQKMISMQKERIKELEQSAIDNTKMGEFIYEHYMEIKELLEKIKSLKGVERTEFIDNHKGILKHEPKNHTITLK